MGLAASQARLLFLTARLSDLELRAQVISNSKIRLANESKEASDEYCRALDKQKYQVATGADKNGPTYADASLFNLTSLDAAENGHQRIIKDQSGRVLVSNSIANAYASAVATTLNLSVPSFSNGLVPSWYRGGVPSPDDYRKMSDAQLKADHFFIEFIYNTQSPDGSPANRPNLDNDTNNTKDMNDVMTLLNDPGKFQYYKKLFLQMLGNDTTIFSQGNYKAINDDNMKSPDWLEMQVQQGNIFLFTEKRQNDGKMAFENVSWDSGDSSVQEVDDETNIARAEAKYNRTMADIQAKDKRFDLQLKNIDTEHTATQTTIDSVKKVIEKDIERNLKMFQA